MYSESQNTLGCCTQGLECHQHPDGRFPPFLLSNTSQKPPPQQSSPDYYRGSLFSLPRSLQKCNSYNPLLTTSAHDSGKRWLVLIYGQSDTTLCSCSGFTSFPWAPACLWCLYIRLREGTVLFYMVTLVCIMPSQLTLGNTGLIKAPSRDSASTPTRLPRDSWSPCLTAVSASTAAKEHSSASQKPEVSWGSSAHKDCPEGVI